MVDPIYILTHNFDPTQIPPRGTTEPLEQRSAGGLGMHLIRHFIDQVT
jgi:anti-sigma regulatory factor (Ser/Thr protein kinase)